MTKQEELDRAIEALRGAKEFGFDFECSGFNPRRDRIRGVSVAVSLNRAWYFPFIGRGAMSFVQTMKALAPILSDMEKTAVLSNAKFDLKFAKMNGVDMKCRIADTMIASWLLNENKEKHGLKFLAREVLGVEMSTYEEAVEQDGGLFDSGRTFADYAKDDARYALKAWKILYPKLQREGLERVFWSLEMEIVRVLVDMELAGVQLNKQWLVEREKMLSAEIVAAREDAIKGAGHTFDPASPKQTSHLLFDVLGLRIFPDMERGKEGYYSTDDDILRRYDHPAAKAISRFRAAQKELSGFVVSYLDKMDGYGRLRAEFLQTGTVTGRFAGKSPNLQNVPRAKGGIRVAFIAPEGKVLICSDFNQVEFRMAGHMAMHYLGWSKIADAYFQGIDAHQKTMTELGIDRRSAKGVNFGFLYGRGWASFAREHELPEDVAKEWRAKFHKTYPEIEQMAEACLVMACKDGYITTITGRRRRFPDLKGRNPRDEELRWEGFRVWNSLVQASTADLVKLTMRAFWKRVQQKRGQDARWEGVNLLMNVHDELVVEAPEEISQEVMDILKFSGENCVKLRVPIVLDVKAGKNWSEAKP